MIEVEFQKMEDVLPANVAASPAGQRQAQKTTEELDLGPIDIEVSAAGITARFQGRIKSFDRPAAEETLAAVRNQLKSWLDIERRLPVRIAGRADVATGLLLRVYDTTLEAGAVHVSLSPAELP
jgi:hypothetical protein